MMWVLVNDENRVRNIIEYDGVSEFVPGAGLRVMQVNDGTKLGDIVETVEE